MLQKHFRIPTLSLGRHIYIQYTTTSLIRTPQSVAVNELECLRHESSNYFIQHLIYLYLQLFVYNIYYKVDFQIIEKFLATDLRNETHMNERSPMNCIFDKNIQISRTHNLVSLSVLIRTTHNSVGQKYRIYLTRI